MRSFFLSALRQLPHTLPPKDLLKGYYSCSSNLFTRYSKRTPTSRQSPLHTHIRLGKVLFAQVFHFYFERTCRHHQRVERVFFASAAFDLAQVVGADADLLCELYLRVSLESAIVGNLSADQAIHLLEFCLYLFVYFCLFCPHHIPLSADLPAQEHTLAPSYICSALPRMPNGLVLSIFDDRIVVVQRRPQSPFSLYSYPYKVFGHILSVQAPPLLACLNIHCPIGKQSIFCSFCRLTSNKIKPLSIISFYTGVKIPFLIMINFTFSMIFHVLLYA